MVVDKHRVGTCRQLGLQLLATYNTVLVPHQASGVVIDCHTEGPFDGNLNRQGIAPTQGIGEKLRGGSGWLGWGFKADDIAVYHCDGIFA